MSLLRRLLAVLALASGAAVAVTLPVEPAVANCVDATCTASRQRRPAQVPADEAPTTGTVDNESGTAGDGAPSIIRRPGEEADRPTNTLGVAVGVTLFVGWIAAGAVMFSRARSRGN